MKRRFITKIISCLMVLCLLMPCAALADEELYELGDSGVEVILAQQRLLELGYLNFRPTGRYGDMTHTAVLAFQKQNELSVTGAINKACFAKLFAYAVKRSPMYEKFVRVSGPSLVSNPGEYGENASWAEVKQVFTLGTTATIVDFNSKYTYTVTRTGGENHAHVEPVSYDDAAMFKKSFGGDYTWEKRPALVKVAGHTYAASVFGYPNAGETVRENNMDGSICIYFNGSTSDIAGIADAEHAANIARAANS